MPLITISYTHTEVAPLGRVLERYTGQMLDGALAGDQVSHLLGWLQQLSRIEQEERISLIILMKTKCWATILARTTMKAVRGKDCSFSKTVP